MTRIGEVALYLLNGEYRRTRGDGTDYRDMSDVIVPAENADSALLEGIALNIARLLESVKVRLNVELKPTAAPISRTEGGTPSCERSIRYSYIFI